MLTYRVNELYVGIIFIGMLIGLVLADLLSFYPSILFKESNQMNIVQVAGFAFIVSASIYMFLKFHRKRSDQNLFAIINNTEELIWSVDKRYRYLAFNQAYEKKHFKIFRKPLKTGDLIWNEKITIDQMLLWKQLINRGLQGEKFMVDLDYSELAGQPCFASVSFNPILGSDNNVSGVGCFFQNITQRILHEAEINKQNEQFKEIAYIISHTVRAPLSNILGLVEVIDEKSPLNKINKQIIDYLKISAKQLDTVVRNVVDRTVKVSIESNKAA